MKVFLNEDIAPRAYSLLTEKCEIVSDMARIGSVEAIITRNIRISRMMMENIPGLKMISVHGTGWDLVDMDAAGELGITVTNVPGENALSVAELAVSFMLALSRRLKYIDKGLREGRWTRPGDGSLISREVSGKTLGLVGTGCVARHTANIMKQGFGMELLCWNPRRSEEECRAMGFRQCNRLEELFSSCDFVSISLPYTKETHGLIGKQVLSAAKPGLILVNTSRGGIVDEKALYDALSNGPLGAAASDVFVTEPPEKDEPLLALDNFIATPHIGATTEEALERVGMKAVENVLSFM